MSRTDKDRPYMVRVNDPLEKARYRVHRHVEWRTGFVGCDFEESERDWIKNYKLGDQYNHWAHCGWHFHYSYGGVPQWFCRAVWYDPERTRERVELADARRLYNAGNDLEDYDFWSPQHRHSARWDWW